MADKRDVTTQLGVQPLSTGGEQRSAAGAGQSQTVVTDQPWYGADLPKELHGDAGKFKTAKDFLGSYKELEGKLSAQGEAIAGHEEFQTKYIKQHFGSQEQFIQWLSEVQNEAGQAGGAGTQAGGQGQQVSPELKAIQDRQAKTDEAHKTTQAQLKERASDDGMDKFLEDYPEAEAEMREIYAILGRGTIRIPKPHLSSSHYGALSTAWTIRQSETAQAKARGEAAATVEGGDGGQGSTEEDAFDMPIPALQKRIVDRYPQAGQ